MATASAKVSATDSTTYRMSVQKIIGPAKAAISDMICAKEGSAAPPMAAMAGAARSELLIYGGSALWMLACCVQAGGRRSARA